MSRLGVLPIARSFEGQHSGNQQLVIKEPLHKPGPISYETTECNQRASIWTTTGNYRTQSISSDNPNHWHRSKKSEVIPIWKRQMWFSRNVIKLKRKDKHEEKKPGRKRIPLHLYIVKLSKTILNTYWLAIETGELVLVIAELQNVSWITALNYFETTNLATSFLYCIHPVNKLLMILLHISNFPFCALIFWMVLRYNIVPVAICGVKTGFVCIYGTSMSLTDSEMNLLRSRFKVLRLYISKI